MSKEKLSIASTDPVALDETEPKKDVAAPSEPKEEVATPAADTNEAKLETSHESKADAVPPVPEKDSKHTPATGEDAPPPPARPLSPLGRMKKELKEAFPNADDKVVHALLIASEGRLDPAFNALLFLLDPTFKPDVVVASAAPATAPAPQPRRLTDDELLARKLQKEFDLEERRRRQQHKQHQPRRHVDDDESPDEFDQLKESFNQGFEEAKTAINGWVSGISRKFSQDDKATHGRTEQTQSPKLFGALGGSSFNSNPRKKFDEDPEILALDFHKKADLKEEDAPRLPKRTDEGKWQPLNLDVPVSSDAFLVDDLDEEDKKA